MDQGIGIIVLAAGNSVRMGTPKQLLRYGGCSLLRHAALVAVESACRPVIVVLPPQAEEFRNEIEALPVTIVENPHRDDGLSTSIRAGLNAYAACENGEGVILMVCDQPFVSAGLIRTLCSTHRASGKDIIACRYAGIAGVPVFFSRAMFGELSRLEGDRGAKALLKEHPDRVALVPFPEGVVDIDTDEDYRRLCRLPDISSIC